MSGLEHCSCTCTICRTEALILNQDAGKFFSCMVYLCRDIHVLKHVQVFINELLGWLTKSFTVASCLGLVIHFVTLKLVYFIFRVHQPIFTNSSAIGLCEKNWLPAWCPKNFGITSCSLQLCVIFPGLELKVECSVSSGSFRTLCSSGECTNLD